jgi:cell division protein FtsQ
VARETSPPTKPRAASASASSSAPPRPSSASSAAPRNQRLPRKKPTAGGKSKSGSGLRVSERAGSAWAGLKGLALWARRPALITLRVLGLVASVAGLVAVGRLLQHHLTTSPAFAIDAIELKGLSRIDRAELLEAAGIDVGKNVFSESPESVRGRLLKHPWIARAEVSRRLPGRFEISVQEREAAALLLVESCDERAGQSTDPSCDDPSSLYLVSDEGHVFKRLEGEDPVDLPVITGVDRLRFGSDPEFRKGVLVQAVALLSEYRSAGLLRRLPIGEIHIEPNDALSIYVGEELTLVRLGHSPFDQKLRRMKKVFDRLERERASAEYVYLDNERRPDRVTVRLR